MSVASDEDRTAHGCNAAGRAGHHADGGGEGGEEARNGGNEGTETGPIEDCGSPAPRLSLHIQKKKDGNGAWPIYLVDFKSPKKKATLDRFP
jgi:hypothetical protein